MSANTHEYMSSPSGNCRATTRAFAFRSRHTVLWTCACLMSGTYRYFKLFLRGTDLEAVVTGQHCYCGIQRRVLQDVSRHLGARRIDQEVTIILS